jgi:predicted dehydrogenase
MPVTNVRPVSWGILGTGMIAGVFARGLAASTTGSLRGVASRNIESAHRFADEFAVPQRYQGYEALLADPAIDAVYISLPNHLHAEWTTRCAEAGKHILCEKPLTVNDEEAETVIEAVRKHDVFMMEAFMYRCHPQTARLAELIRSGAIGRVRVIQAHFSYNMHGPRDNIRQQNAAAGGGIMDVGCYTASMARLIAGAATGREFADPIDTSSGLALTGFAHIGQRSRIDEWATAAVLFPGDIVANLTCGIQVQVDMALRIWGSEGHIVVPNPWFPDHIRPDSDGSTHILVYRDGETAPQDIESPAGLPLYAIEADTVARHIAHRQAPSPCMTWDDSLSNMRMLDAWRRAIGLVFDVEKV